MYSVFLKQPDTLNFSPVVAMKLFLISKLMHVPVRRLSKMKIFAGKQELSYALTVVKNKQAS